MAVRTMHEHQDESLYFITFTCYKWLHLFEEIFAYDLVYQWFDHLLIQNIRVVGFVIMPNHLHVLLHFKEMKYSLAKVIANGKRFLAYGIVKKLVEQNKDEILLILKNGVTRSAGRKGQLHKVFQESFDAKLCFSPRFIEQKLNYIHNNPVSGKWNLAVDLYSYPHSSASFYEFGNCVYKNIIRLDELM
jgi:putative transposase